MNTGGSKQYLIKNSISTFIRVGVSSLSTLIIIPFIIKHIGLSLFGYISITSFFISYAGIFDIGISKALVYLVNGNSVTDRQKNDYISAFYFINFVIIGLVLILGFLCIYLQLPILGKSVPSDSRYYIIITTVSIIILALSIFNMLQYAILEAYLKLDSANYGVMLKIMVLNMLYIVNLFTCNNIKFYIISALIAVSVTTIYYYVVIRTTVHYTISKITMQYVKDIFRISIKFAGVGIFSSINSAMPRIAITYLSNGLVGIAILDVITKLSMSIINLGGSLARPLFALSRINPQRIKAQWKKILSIYLVAGLSSIAFVIVFRNQITEFFFHDPDIKYLLNYLLIIYVIAAVIYLVGQPISMYLMGNGNIKKVTKIIAYNSILFILIFIICNYFMDSTLVSISVANIVMAFSYTFGLFSHSIKN